jgi:hypothetical protein
MRGGNFRLFLRGWGKNGNKCEQKMNFFFLHLLTFFRRSVILKMKRDSKRAIGAKALLRPQRELELSKQLQRRRRANAALLRLFASLRVLKTHRAQREGRRRK